MNPIQGRNATLAVRTTGSTYVPMLCCMEVTFKVAVDLIEKTGPNSTGRERYRRIEDFQSTLVGATPIADDTLVTFFDIYEQRKTAQSFQLTFEDDVGNIRQFTGDGIFGEISIGGNMNSLVQSPIEIFWHGEPTLTKTGSDTIESG